MAQICQRNDCAEILSVPVTMSHTISPTSSYKEGNLAYDANGNLKTLQRTNAAGTMQDNLTYAYNTDKNQLNSVADATGSSTGVNDIGTQTAGNYQYDAIGRMTRNNLENIDYSYNLQGLVIQVIKAGHTVVKFDYNERGQRIKKESYNTASPYTLTNTDYYILDLSGNVMAIYNQPNGSGAIVQKDLPIFGLSRLGVYNRASGSTYEITDHLGNVRAVVQKNTSTGTTDIKSYADYYPFGELLPSRNSLNYRYAFQGQEKDGETEMEAFQLRLWDGRLGRWLSPDPMGQYASPYLGMGNNPVNMIDPDGGFAEGPGDPKPSLWQSLLNWFSVKPTELDEVVVYGKGKSSNSNFFTDLFDFNPHNTVATENRNFLFGWWNSKETKNYISGLQEIRSDMEYVPGVDSYFSIVMDKNYKAAALQGAVNLIPFGKIAGPLKHKVPGVVTKGMTKILSGEAQPILKNGAVEVLSEGVGKAPKKWLGAIHFTIEDVPGTSMNGSRILVKEVNGQKVYGYIKDHNYEKVFDIATSSELIWP